MKHLKKYKLFEFSGNDPYGEEDWNTPILDDFINYNNIPVLKNTPITIALLISRKDWYTFVSQFLEENDYKWIHGGSIKKYSPTFIGEQIILYIYKDKKQFFYGSDTKELAI
jgi:hypothetical protein